MGLFGSNPEKKLKKAEELLGAGRHYDARKAFLELVRQGAKVPGSTREAAVRGEREARQGMVEERVREATALERAGEIGAARDRIETALDLAGDDIDRHGLEETLRRLTSQPRTGAPTDASELPRDLLPDRMDRETAPAALDEPSEDEVFGPDFESTFEFYMETVSRDLAEVFRAQPEPFRRGYVASLQGAPKMALRYYGELGAVELPPEVELERARTFLMDRKAEDALAVLDGIANPDVATRWTRVDVLRELGRHEDAVSAAAELVNSLAEHNESADALLAWTLLDAGRPAEAWEHLEGWVANGTISEEVLVPAAQAASLLGRAVEAAKLLEGLIQYRLHESLQSGREPNFPVQAGRRLLGLLLDRPPVEREKERIRALALHLLDYDEINAETYRQILLEF
ncbi:MAG: hypothetical protein R3E97_14265 [Candidatus Eisenbacteria bacterium]